MPFKDLPQGTTHSENDGCGIKEHNKEIYLITDTHFNHKKMVEYCGRPENFDELIWASLESLPADCTLIHLGDICIGKDAEVHERIKKLPYEKILVKGNHDKKSDKWYRERGWDKVVLEMTGHYEGKYMTFSHIPIAKIKNMNIHGHFHNSLHRILEGKWVVEGEKERNEEAVKIYNPKLHKLLAIEFTNYQAVSLKEFLDKNI